MQEEEEEELTVFMDAVRKKFLSLKILIQLYSC
jgi:hypothetical protein